MKSDRLPGDVSTSDRAAGQEASARVLGRLQPEGRIPTEAGDPAFTAPWELRAFAIGVALTESGRLDWSRFQAALIDEIAGWEAEAEDATGEWSYYRRWMAALEAVASEGELIEADRLEERTSEILAMSRHAH